MRYLQDLSIFFAELGEALRVDSFGMLPGFLESLEQEFAHLQGPGLLVDLMLELELAEVMGVAQGVGEGVALVAAKAVMHQRALILGEESKVFEGLTTSLAMNAQPGQALPDENVQPGRTLGSQTAFIGPKNRALEEGFPDALISLLEPGGHFADPVNHARSARTQPAQALQNLAGACHGDHVVVVERDGKSLERGPY